MAEKMLFLAEHPKIAEEMGKAARKRIEEKYSWESFFKSFDKLVRKVAKKKE